MNEPVLTIGMFVFGLPRMVYDDLARRAAWRWGESERFGARAAAQYLGPGEETISISGVLVPEIAGAFSDIESLREMATSGEVWPVVLGNGQVLGDFRITAIDDRWRNIVEGGLPRAVDFSVELKRVDA
ncbi:phage tail protein [Novosphingobium aquae]|uniref:Phage tail protein n=1 Tax=Novosphingobium aquae TaxID=3133435 RepID=A0ABU8S4B9_9SPHN